PLAAVLGAHLPRHPTHHRAELHPRDRRQPLGVRGALYHDGRCQRHLHLRDPDAADGLQLPPGGTRIRDGDRAARDRPRRHLRAAQALPRREGRPDMTTANPTRARAAAAASGTVKYVSLMIGALAAIIPLSVLFIASFKTSSEFGQTGPFDLPANWFNFANYVEAFQKGGMIEGFVNTSIILAISLAGTIVIGSMAAYAIDRFRFRGNRLVVALFLIATLIPGVTSQVATFQIINGLGLYNSMAALILLFMGTDII